MNTLRIAAVRLWDDQRRLPARNGPPMAHGNEMDGNSTQGPPPGLVSPVYVSVVKTASATAMAGVSSSSCATCYLRCVLPVYRTDGVCLMKQACACARAPDSCVDGGLLAAFMAPFRRRGAAKPIALRQDKLFSAIEGRRPCGQIFFYLVDMHEHFCGFLQVVPIRATHAE